MQVEKEKGRVGGEKRYSIRSVQKPRHDQARRPSKIWDVSPWILVLIVNAPHKGKYAGA